MNVYSPTLSGKKSNEILQGGLSSIKHAATSVAKKLDEIKEAISANSTPVKTNLITDKDQSNDDDLSNLDNESASRRASDLDIWSKLSESRKSSYNNLVPLGENNPSSYIYPVLPDTIYSPTDNIETSFECDINIQLTSCSQCHNCTVLLYDEEIMAGWSAEDSNLNTTCHACGKLTVPFLSIQINVDEKIKDFKQSDSLSVPYLNPLVLRKELENILMQDGDAALLNNSFVDEHPIIYWNLVWITNRIDVTTYLPQLCLPKPVRFSIKFIRLLFSLINLYMYVDNFIIIFRKLEQSIH